VVPNIPTDLSVKRFGYDIVLLQMHAAGLFNGAVRRFSPPSSAAKYAAPAGVVVPQWLRGYV
jgi:hypothetical protein